MYERECVVCWEKFWGAKNALYCCVQCRDEARRQMRKLRRDGIAALIEEGQVSGYETQPKLQSIREIAGHWRLTVDQGKGFPHFVDLGRVPLDNYVRYLQRIHDNG